jgi:hypothetical protein
MAHTVQIIDHKQLNDGQLALKAECCGDKSTHSWLTCAASVVVDDAQFQDAISFHAQRVGLLHESMQQALSRAKNTIGTKISVTPSASALEQAEATVKNLVGVTHQIDVPATVAVQ